MKKYKLDNYKLGGFQILKWKPLKVRQDGTVSKEEWINDGYYPNIEVVVSVLLKKEIKVIDAPLREQLEQLPQAIEDARISIIENLELGELLN